MASSITGSNPSVTICDFLLASLLHSLSLNDAITCLLGWFQEESQAFVIKTVIPVFSPQEVALLDRQVYSQQQRFIEVIGVASRVPGKRRKSRKFFATPSALLDTIEARRHSNVTLPLLHLLQFEEDGELAGILHGGEELVPVSIVGSFDWSLSRFAREAYAWEPFVLSPSQNNGSTEKIGIEDDAKIRQAIDAYTGECHEYEAMLAEYNRIRAN